MRNRILFLGLLGLCSCSSLQGHNYPVYESSAVAANHGDRHPAMTDQECHDALAQKDQQIAGLIAALGSKPAVNTSSGPGWTCEAVCIQNLIGTGWRHPGKLFQSNILVSAPTAEEAFNKMIEKCKTDAAATLTNHPGDYASANVAGIMTKSEINSPDWESKMVKSFDKDPPLQKFCINK